MENQALSYQELENILRLLDASQRDGTVEVRLGDIKLKVTKGDASAPAPAAPAPAPAAPAPAPAAPVAPAAPTPVEAAPTAAPAAAAPDQPAPAAAPAAAAPAAPTADVPTADIPAGHTVRSPMNGVFYLQPSPGAPAFVEEGARVEAGEDLAIIEVMKLMNRLTSPVSGIVRRVCAANEQLVEKDAALFIIETDEAGAQ